MSKLTLSALRLHQIMYTMVYPAVLGSFIYAYWDKVAKNEFIWAEPSPWVCGFLFIALFTLDYTYSIGDSIQKSYSAAEFLFDFIILVLLFITAQEIFGTKIRALESFSVWTYLLAIKAVASAWELTRYRRLKNETQNGGSITFRRPLPLFPLGTDIAFLIAALLLWLASLVVPAPYHFLLLAGFLIGDGLLYIANTSDS
jgi:hypothetical protein